MLKKLNDKIDKINNKTATITGYIQENFIKSLCVGMGWVHINAYFSAYYSNTLHLSNKNFSGNICFWIGIIILLKVLNYSIMDYYKPTVKEIENKIECLRFIWENK